MAADLNWIIKTHGEFLKKFGISQEKITNEYENWKSNHPDYLTTDYFLYELLRQASLLNMKNAKTEEEYVRFSIEIIQKEIAIPTVFSWEDRLYLEQQLHLDKLILSHLTLPFKFDVQIKADKCCNYCVKRNNKIYSYEKILEKKYLPFAKCNNADGCKCSYSVVPLVDEKGNLLPTNLS